MSHGQAVAKNAAWLMAATAAQKAIAFLTFTFVARFVGVEVTGKFFYAVSVTSVFVILTDLGLTPVVIRETASDVASGSAALARALWAKIGLIPLAIAASLGYVFLTGQSTDVLTAVALACFVMSCDAVSLTWYGAIRGRRQLKYEALGMFVGQAVSAIIMSLSAILHGGVDGLIVGLIGGSAWNVGWSVLQAKRLGVAPEAKAAWPWKRLFVEALPFALAGMFVKVYSYIDTLLLRHYYDAIQVGYYAVAYKVTYAFQFLPLTFVAALYPGMSAAHAAKDKPALQNLLAGSLRLMIVTSVPISAGLSAFAPRFIPLVYGKAFLGSAAPLALLAWVMIPIFLDFPIGSLLNATRRASLKTTAMGLTMVVNVIANVILVPLYGPVGAAISGLISFWMLFFFGAWFVRNDFESFAWAAMLFVRGLIAAAVIWTFVHFVAIRLPLPIGIVAAGIVAVGVLLAARLLLVQDFQLLRRFLARKPSPIVTKEDEPHDESA